MRKVLLAYMPVFHDGYRQFLERHSDASELYIFGRSIINRFDWLARKDIRAVDPSLMCRIISSLGFVPKVYTLKEELVEDLKSRGSKLVFADEEESREVALQLFEGSNVSFDKVFLRWDKPRVLDEKNAEGFPVTADDFHQRFIRQGLELAQKSSDWWLGVGAVLVVGDVIITSWNRHLPSEHIPYVLGDPRSFFKKGINVELTNVLHAEAAVIGAAALEGISTKGARLYVTTFPCPFCANVLSETGIEEVYFYSGYSMLDSVAILESRGIKLFRVSL